MEGKGVEARGETCDEGMCLFEIVSFSLGLMLNFSING